MEFDLFGLSVKDLSSQNVIARCNNSGPLYTMCLPSHSAPSPCVAPATALAASASTWHRCLGHPGVDALSKLPSDSSVICYSHNHDFCHACQLGRHTRIPFVSSTSRTDNTFDLIHCDLWTSPIVSVSGYKYYLVILDDHSHFVWIFYLRVKSDTLSYFSLMYSHSLAASSKSSSATMAMSSLTPSLTHSSPPKGYFYGCLVHILLRRTVKSSVSFTPSIICCVPWFFRLLFQLTTW
jgi:hypothetical protein